MFKIKNIKGQKIVKNYLTQYGKYVLEDRAVPDYRDGLKPVQRRLLYTMYENGYFHNKPPVKSAKVIGATIGNYHPHGDSSAYDALVNIVNNRYKTIQGHGNWGSIGGDAPAAYRYTECRLTPFSHWIFDCMNVGSYCQNYDDTRKEPIVMPSRIPLFFVNGNEGIAVGIRCSIPPFNLTEIINAMIFIIKNKNKDITVKDIQKIVKAPDYGRGSLLSNSKEVRKMYATGEGSLVYSCKYYIEDRKDGIHDLIIHSYAPMFNPKTFIQNCKEYVEDGLIEYCREATDKTGYKVIVGYKNSTILKTTILPLLQKSVSYFFYVTIRGKKDIKVVKTSFIPLMKNWIDYRRKVEHRFLTLELSNIVEKISRERAILIAINNIVIIADALKKPNTEEIIKKKLKLTDFQVEVIMNTTVRSLKRKNETDVKSKIKDYEVVEKNLKYKLNNIDEHILDIFEKIKKDVAPDKRGTDLKTDDVEIKGSQTGGLYVISNGKNLRKLPRVTGAFKLKHITKDGTGVTTVNDHGIVGYWNLVDIPNGDVDSLYSPIVGIVPYSKNKLVCLTNMGNINVIENPQNKDGFKAIKLKDKEYVIKVVGLVEGDKLLYYNNENIVSIPYKKLEVKRNNIYGKRHIPRVKKGIDIEVVGKNDIVIYNKKVIEDKSIFAIAFPLNGPIFVAGSEIYINKRIKNRKHVIRFLKKKNPNIYVNVM